MNFKMILRIQSQAMFSLSVTLLVPIIYSLIYFDSYEITIVFAIIGIISAITGIIFQRYSVGRFQRAPLAESAMSILMMYPILAVFGCLPFIVTGYLMPTNALLETIGDLTSAGLPILPTDAPYILHIWQSCLMWLGSLLFLLMMVTVLPEISGDFGLSLSLPGGQGFSAVIGQMNLMSIRIIKIYVVLTLVSVCIFKLSGLYFWDSLIMAMRCISTGGGSFIPEHRNFYFEYAAMFVMLLACGNFLVYYHVIRSLIPPAPKFEISYLTRLKQYFLRLRRTVFANLKMIFFNEEIKILFLIIIVFMLFLTFRGIYNEIYFDGNVALRQALFHIASFLSTTGLVIEEASELPHDVDMLFIFLMAMLGGCIGSVTGGFKIMRLIILFKITAAEVKKTIHPNMMTVIRVGDTPVPIKIVGRILGYFFLVIITLFICAAVLSFTGAKLSESFGMAAACLSTVGNLPGFCDSEDFINLSRFGKFFCMLMMIIGRLEMFAFLIALSGIKFRRKKSNW
ncbi:MAG: hypothetical protein K6G55_00725 [Selenomonadaceae bacterium]|nr:hypothetical protein [Selenomonadaceae bacterium]